MHFCRDFALFGVHFWPKSGDGDTKTFYRTGAGYQLIVPILLFESQRSFFPDAGSLCPRRICHEDNRPNRGQDRRPCFYREAGN